MTTYTEVELATETMHVPGLLGIEETLSAAEYEDVIRSNASAIAAMNSICVSIWNGSVIDVPEEYFLELAVRCSLPVQLKNGLIDHQTYLALVEASERRLTVME